MAIRLENITKLTEQELLRRRKPICINGVVYASVSEAAESLGYEDDSALHRKMRNPHFDPDMVEYGRHCGNRKREIFVNGVRYPSVHYFSDKFGIPYTTMKRQLRKFGPKLTMTVEPRFNFSAGDASD